MRGYEVGEDGLHRVPIAVAAPSSRVAVGSVVQYLGFWRVSAQVTSGPESVWRHLERRLGGQPCYFYIPGFSWRRAEVQQLGVRVTQAQPALDLCSEPGCWGVVGASVAQVAAGELRAGATVLPVLLGYKDARTLTRFISLALEVASSDSVQLEEYEIKPYREELIFIPAVRDARFVQDAGWRLLLEEFDSLIA
ncbi:MAG: hypothetical protein N3B14_03245 [Thermoleophilia bacterium]|nr:hypothetical protein [Thermoleophilia bacterium]